MIYIDNRLQDVSMVSIDLNWWLLGAPSGEYCRLPKKELLVIWRHNGRYARVAIFNNGYRETALLNDKYSTHAGPQSLPVRRTKLSVD